MDADLLQTSELFEGLALDDLASIAERFEEFEVLHGTDLTDQGEFSHKFFVILEGEVDVKRDGETIDTMGAGGFFGEVGLLTNARRNARVMARGRVRLARMMHWDFTELAERYPVLTERLEAVAKQRLVDPEQD